MFDQRHTGRQIVAGTGERLDGSRRADQDQITALRRAGNDTIETDGSACRGVPDNDRCWPQGAREPDGGDADGGGDGYDALSHHSSSDSDVE